MRATALDALARYPSREPLEAARRHLDAAEPLVRLAALRTLRILPVEQSWPLARDLLSDPVRGVRLEAASVLTAMPQDRMAPADLEHFSRAQADYAVAQRLNGDRSATCTPSRVSRRRPKPSIWPLARSIRASCRPT